MPFYTSKLSKKEITKKLAIRTADRIGREIKDQEQLDPSRVCVDISCMTHETLLILFSLLENNFPDDFTKVHYMYCPAKEYGPGEPYENKWLSRGVKGGRSILGYPCQLRPSRRSRLVMLVGFEVDRASGLIDVYEPSSLGLGYGDDSLNPVHAVVNSQKHKRLSDRYPSAQKFCFSSGDAYLVRDQLINEAEKYSEFNLIVAPMNSKISTLGAALATIDHPNIQLCYAPASIYNFFNYSDSEDYCYAFNV